MIRPAPATVAVGGVMCATLRRVACHTLGGLYVVSYARCPRWRLCEDLPCGMADTAGGARPSRCSFPTRGADQHAQAKCKAEGTVWYACAAWPLPPSPATESRSVLQYAEYRARLQYPTLCCFVCAPPIESRDPDSSSVDEYTHCTVANAPTYGDQSADADTARSRESEQRRRRIPHGVDRQRHGISPWGRHSAWRRRTTSAATTTPTKGSCVSGCSASGVSCTPHLVCCMRLARLQRVLRCA